MNNMNVSSIEFLPIKEALQRGNSIFISPTNIEFQYLLLLFTHKRLQLETFMGVNNMFYY